MGAVYLEMLDARAAWKINRVLRERQILVSELTTAIVSSPISRGNMPA